MECHTDTWGVDYYLLPYQSEYEISQHAVGHTDERKGGSCNGCHTNEGFQNIVETGSTEDLAQSSQVGCFTCHAPHTMEDFSLRWEMATDIALGEGTYDKGTSNICAACHQARTPRPPVDSEDDITYFRWGPHHGPQSNVLAGIGAWQISTADPYRTTAQHNTNVPNGCVDCHMAELPGSGVSGGHTFWMRWDDHGTMVINSNGCAALNCHGGDFTDDDEATVYVDDAALEFQAKLDELKTALVANGWLTEDDYVNTDTPPVDPDDRGAVLNYLIFLEDRSNGAHNILYATDAIDASIEHAQAKLLP
ncbi:MAG: hypothetical protein GF346_11870 [Candidatus Eisenbacteria bacterium]|nr:hypothetical protein [Candidatus Latescibacterota bacterium]MBD3303134.1 hypothetical protein [Candidatus Eisenbacteria bacterium]